VGDVTPTDRKDPRAFKVERDVGGGQLEAALTTSNETAAREEYARRGGAWRLVTYPLGDKRDWTLLAGASPHASEAWPYNAPAS
jgi:hypothetical protein